MADKSNGVPDSQQPDQRNHPSGGSCRIWSACMLLGGALLLALLTANLWLLYANVRLSTRSDQAYQFWILCHDGSSRQERTQAFLRLAGSGNTEWRSARLMTLDLSGADLEGVNLHAADLSQSDLTDANLASAALTACVFQTAVLENANLENAELSEIDFLKASLRGAKLRGAKLNVASLEQADVSNADLILADLTDAHLLMTDLSGANLTGANLTGANMESARLINAELSLTRLMGADLRDADFTDSNWWRARGLSTAQIAELQQKFPPSENTTESRKNDYRLWLEGQKESAK